MESHKTTKTPPGPSTVNPQKKQRMGTLRIDNANVFATYLADVFTAGRGHIDDDVADFITAPWQMSLPIRAYTTAEAKAEITRLNTCKAPELRSYNRTDTETFTLQNDCSLNPTL